MIDTSDRVKRGDILKADICIIGSGAAGISMALQYIGSSKKVIVLEGGGLEETKENQELYTLDTSGLPIKRESRIRVFGGTTTRWTGGWKPHNPIDFTYRSWVPYSGWPISYQDLEPYYTQAAELLNTPLLSEYEEVLENAQASSQGLNSPKLTHVIIRSLPENDWNFGKKFFNHIKNDENVRVILESHVQLLEMEGTKVTQIRVKKSNGEDFFIHARVVIVACGGIENARLLLASAIGNQYDQVGRYYMDHPKGIVGIVTLKKGLSWKGIYDGFPIGFTRGIRLSDIEQERLQVLNSYVRFEPIYTDKTFFHKIIRRLGFTRVTSYTVRNFMEQVPNPENRVRLGTKKDRLGSLLPVVDWSLSELDKKTLRVLHGVLRDEMVRKNVGDFKSELLEEMEYDWKSVKDASHHMGTTRMGIDPKFSVVDQNCKVHGVNNLYIAGSSVFPTSGYANPTAAIVALALRLTSHIKDILK